MPPTYPYTLNAESPQAEGLIAWWPVIGIADDPGTEMIADKHLTLTDIIYDEEEQGRI